MLVERLVLAALACVLVGHHVADFVVAAIAGWPATARLTSEEVAGVLAAVLLGVLWLRARMGHDLPSRLVAARRVGRGGRARRRRGVGQP